MPFPLFLLRFLTFGRRSEILALDYLRKQGYRIVSSGYRMKGGEVDIIAWDGDVLVFVEVKARQNTEPPEDAVGRPKQRRLIRAAEGYIARRRLHETPYRFDIVTVTALPRSQPRFRLIRDAFNGELEQA